LQEQDKQCKQSLLLLVWAAEANRRMAVEHQTATRWLDEYLNRWHLMRTEVSYRIYKLGNGEVPMLAPPPELTHALL
ncbi:sensor histidine kinase, partial [Pseudomonas syringae pv. tagetis]